VERNALNHTGIFQSHMRDTSPLVGRMIATAASRRKPARSGA
jgi:hypothetical protein